MKDSERDTVLLLLAAASGSADGWSYFGIGHAFVANMTGNTVLLGVAIFHLHGDVRGPLLALVGYLIGTAVGTMLTRRAPPGTRWHSSVSWTLFLESLLLIGAEAAWVTTHQRLSASFALVLLGSVAVAIGMQSGAMMRLRIPGIVTTYISGTWTSVAHGLTLLAAHQPRIERQKEKFEEHSCFRPLCSLSISSRRSSPVGPFATRPRWLAGSPRSLSSLLPVMAPFAINRIDTILSHFRASFIGEERTAWPLKSSTGARAS